jgi:2-polyprenyl-6-methoxyphenol hydroxylase-like FAD-dependent oxidoreductase/uncharacterized membrane protein
MNHQTTTHDRRVLIVGLGIAGMASAIRLHKLGWQPVMIERAPARRTGGHSMWLFDAGEATAKRLGILDNLTDRTDPNAPTYEINREDERHKGFSFADGPRQGRKLLRGDIEQALFEELPSNVEIRFATTLTAIAQDADSATVTLKHLPTNVETTERFDLVLGADGVRSTVRKLVFGPHEDYLESLNYMIATVTLKKPLEGYRRDESLILAEAGRSAWVFAYTNHNPTVLFSYKTNDVREELSRQPIESLRRAFGEQPTGSLLGQILDQYETAEDASFASVDQVKMDRWHNGRVALVGDAAWCLTLYSGMGASTALSGSQLLGDMLEIYPDDLEQAFNHWEARLHPFVEAVQQEALIDRVIFTPESEVQRVVRATVFSMLSSPVLARVVEGMNSSKNWKSFDIVTRSMPTQGNTTKPVRITDVDTVLVAEFDDDPRATQALSVLKQAAANGQVVLARAGVVKRSAQSEWQLLDQYSAIDERAGTKAGGLVGTLLGALTGPLGTLIGGATGAFIGAARDKAAAAYDETVKNQLVELVQPGTTALIAAIGSAANDGVDGEMRQLGGVVKHVAADTLKAAIDAEVEVQRVANRAERQQQAQAWFGNQRQQFDGVWNKARQKVQAVIAESRGKL